MSPSWHNGPRPEPVAGPPPDPPEAQYPRSMSERPVTPGPPAPLGKGHFFTSMLHPNAEVGLGGERTYSKSHRYSMPGTHIEDVCISAELVPNQAVDDNGEWTLPGLRVVWFRPTP